jgi:hypothetical protein
MVYTTFTDELQPVSRQTGELPIGIVPERSREDRSEHGGESRLTCLEPEDFEQDVCAPSGLLPS